MRLSSILKETVKLDNVFLDKVLSYFRDSKKPTTVDIDKLSIKLGVPKEQLYDSIFDLLSEFSTKIGRHVSTKDENVDANELAMGIKVESEHTDSEYIARLIALDHLSELKDYYSRLAEMEKTAKD